MTLTILRQPTINPGNHISEHLNFYILKVTVCFQTPNPSSPKLGSSPCTGLTNQVQLKTKHLHLCLIIANAFTYSKFKVKD